MQIETYVPPCSATANFVLNTFAKGSNRMVGIGPDVLSVHMLRPYQDPDKAEEGGWVEFRPRIETALGAYWKVRTNRACSMTPRAGL